jgi:hypothetical protein
VGMMGKIFEEEKWDEGIRGTIENEKRKNARDVESSIPWLQSMRWNDWEERHTREKM